jgi:hypothetical protein
MAAAAAAANGVDWLAGGSYRKNFFKFIEKRKRFRFIYT